MPARSEAGCTMPQGPPVRPGPWGPPGMPHRAQHWGPARRSWPLPPGLGPTPPPGGADGHQ
eukprot:1147453-Alexandrium_andersonii.AAC.1